MKKGFFLLILLLGLIQLIGVERTNPPVDPEAELKAPEAIAALLKKSCYDCHSNETVWPDYSAAAPVSFFVVSHVEDGRKALNFSEWKNIPESIKVPRLKRSILTLHNGMMPLSSYIWLHEEAELTQDERKLLAGWFNTELKAYEEP